METILFRTFEQTALTLADFNKPVLMAEFGLGGNPEGTTQPEPEATQLAEGLEMHNGIWSAFFAKSRRIFGGGTIISTPVIFMAYIRRFRFTTPTRISPTAI